MVKALLKLKRAISTTSSPLQMGHLLHYKSERLVLHILCLENTCWLFLFPMT